MGKMEAAEQTGSAQLSPNSRAQTVTLRQLSTESQNVWIERLFSRLAALYGAAFGRQWEGTNIADVKTVWAEKLGGFEDKPQAIKGALDALDEHPYPPTLPEFIILCRTAARRIGTDKPLLECKLTPEQIERNKQRVAEMISGLMKAKSL